MSTQIKKTMIRRMMFIAVLLLSLVFAPTSYAVPLTAFGPRDLPIPPGTGFPLWYTDSNGLSIAQCNDPASGFCIFLPDEFFNGANPVFPTNWPAESFYYLLETFAGPLFYRTVIETGFGGLGNPADGQQAVFSRVRFRADLDAVGKTGNYTITHPYGVDVINVPALGPGPDLNQTLDVFGLIALSFNGPLDVTSAVGPFLRASATPGGAPLPFATDAAGNLYLANPAASIPVTGSPLGTNFVEIRDPDGIVIGRIDTFNLQGKVMGMSASPSALTFAAQKPAVISSLTVTITNPSITSSATLATGVVTGANAADFTLGVDGCSGTVVPASGTCSVTVNFSEAAPGLFGAKSAVVSFPVTTPALPPATINLAGSIDNQLPTVTTTIPANNAINVPANNAITATFSEAVTGVSSTTFTLISGGAPVAGAVTFNAASNTAVFTPAANLAVSGNFTATLVGAGITDLAGNALAADTVINFTTTLPDTTAPAVVSVAPANNTLVVPTSSVITVKFNEPVDPASVNESTITVKTSAGSVAGAVTYDTVTLTATFKPTQALANNQLHTVTVTTGVKSLGNVAMAATFTSTFVTNAAPTKPVLVAPSSGQTGVGTTVNFQWIKATDSDPNDTVTYKLFYCTNQFMVNCDPVTVAQNASLHETLAGLGGYGAGLLLAGVFIAGGAKSRRKLFLFIAVLLISGMVATACSKSSNDEPAGPLGPGGSIIDPATLVTKNVSGLTPATTYYWKVVADDGHGGLTESDVSSFKTQ